MSILKRIRRAFVVWKIRLDLGMSFMGLLQLVLLIIAASGPLLSFFHLRKMWILIVLITAFGLGGVLIFGYFLDAGMKYLQTYNSENMDRTPYWIEMMERLKRIEREVKSRGTEEGK